MNPAWTLPERLRRAGAGSPSGAAIRAGGRSWTWAELDRAADAVAARVVAEGTEPGSVVAVETADVPWAIGAIAGVLRAGAVAGLVPVGLSSGDRGRALDVLRPVLLLGPDDAPSRVPTAFDAATATRPTDEAPAVVVLTSGTTGSPKGVVLSHRAMAASADAWLTALPPVSGWLLAVGLAHVAGLGIVWRAAGQGVPLRVVAPADTAGILAALAADDSTSHVSLVPTQLDRLLDLPGAAPPGHLRAVLLGGGPIPPALVTRASAAGWPVIPTYGLSEAGSGVTALPAAEVLEAAGTAGRPLPGVTVTIDAPDADGIGEIVVTTPGRSSGYLGDPAVDPSVPLRTGDLGRFDAAGRLTVIDRRDDRIVRGGENIDPAEVESVLRTHPAVADAAVVGLPDARLGRVPVAAIVPAVGAISPSPEDLAGHVRASLAGFKVPAAVHRLDALPRTPGGKLRRGAIRALLAGEPSGELARPDGAAIAWRRTDPAGHTDPSRSQPLVLLPGTLSNAAQLDRLAAGIAAPGGIAVHALDRRGTGEGRLAPGSTGRPLDVAVHVADLVAYLDARAIERAVIAGISFGGVLALEFAARHPGRVVAVVAWEPPYGPLADVATQRAFADLAAAVPAAHARGGPPAAAETFLRAVAGDAAWDRLSPRAREALGRAGDGALTDSALLGLDPDGLLAITAPTTILVGDRSEPFYAPIATALAAAVPGASVRVLAGLGHPAPITHPAPVAAAIRDAVRATLGPP